MDPCVFASADHVWQHNMQAQKLYILKIVVAMSTVTALTMVMINGGMLATVTMMMMMMMMM